MGREVYLVCEKVEADVLSMIELRGELILNGFEMRRNIINIEGFSKKLIFVYKKGKDYKGWEEVIKELKKNDFVVYFYVIEGNLVSVKEFRKWVGKGESMKEQLVLVRRVYNDMVVRLLNVFMRSYIGISMIIKKSKR